MSKKNFHIVRLFFALIIVFAISFLFCQTGVFNSLYSTLFAGANSVSYSEYKNSQVLAENSLTDIYITSISVENKEYDGTTSITISNIVAKDVNNNVFEGSITATANTYDPNAGTNKAVEFSNFQIVGEEANFYQIAGYNYGTVLVDILPYGYNVANTLKWEIRDVFSSNQPIISPSGFVYNGQDQRKGVLAYYKNINNEKEYLFVNIVKNDSSNQFKNDFITAGDYEASVILTQKEQNYKLVDNDGDTKLSLSIKKATPQISYNTNQIYTYTGQQQSLRNYVSLNNQEQTLTFENDTFTNLNEGKNLVVKVTAKASQNYKALTLEYQVPAENFIKRTGNINVENIPLEYTYNGQEQTIEHLAFIEDDINLEEPEQNLLYSYQQTFIDCEQNREIIIFALETENFNAISKSIYININKAKIDTTNWKWSPSIFNYDGLIHSVLINGYNQNLVSVEYTNNQQVNAGTYVASAKFTLLNLNFEEVKFPSITWKINKTQIIKPNLEDRISTYTGVLQQADILQSMYYQVENNYNKNAGNYKVLISLTDANNFEWRDGSVSPLTINWSIKKAQIDTPIYTKVLNYTGSNLFLQIPTNDLYSVVCPEQREVGSYQAYLFLTDAENYEWAENPEQPYLEIDWSITDRLYNSSYSIVAIVIVSLIIIVLAVYVTLHFTNKARRHRKRRKLASLETKTQLERTTLGFYNEENLITTSKLVETPKESNKNSLTTASKLVEKQKDTNLENNKTKNESLKTSTNQGNESLPVKTRKKRMLSMKKNDKKERRKKENKKLSKLKKGTAKRGRPSKKKSK